MEDVDLVLTPSQELLQRAHASVKTVAGLLVRKWLVIGHETGESSRKWRLDNILPFMSPTCINLPDS